ncbi:ABC transporter ATP-binding protein [Microterricola viridarii]|uniref:Peptide/nickel transport system ATP-binding protein n=1 Tax=Microterricola viridarii TaxID=412690 RepID=A0A1H1PQE5_9MICO|nr:ABC transporter ATP-binding protein [Microterricola viridarii]SDS12979.1 peptide/nickel transport system ATP-binding protein [Microterricola viridarii]
MPILEVQNLTVRIPTEDGTVHAVQDVSFSVEPGEFFGIVGESGSGKSVMVQSVMGLVPAAETSGRVLFDGVDLLALDDKGLRSIRGRAISMVFQDPLSSLHPQYTIGWQIVEQIQAHEKVSHAEAKARAIEMLKKVKIPNAEKRFDSYPHQFSGGMRQRVMIAMALVLKPALVIADEPTTALDSTVQAQILDLLDEMRRELGTTILMISHDLGVLRRVADRVMVMYAGRRMETGAVEAVFAAPAHPYTAGLLRSSSFNREPGTRLIPIAGKPPSLLAPGPGCPFAARCPDVSAACSAPPPIRRYDDGVEAQCWLEEAPSELAEPASAISTAIDLELGHATAPAEVPIAEVSGLELSFAVGKRAEAHVLKGIDLTVRRGETLGLVGESGCGKTTLARVIAGLELPTGGTVTFDGRDVASLSKREWRQLRTQVQLVFQDPFGSLNPRRRVGSIIGDPFRIHKVSSGQERLRSVQQLMELVGLNPEHYNRFPSQFSGGQRQRIGIARALALNPELIILDEPVSALDVSIQAQVLNLLDDLQKEFGLTYLFISHDLSVVRHVCDRIAVMDGGRIVELGDAQSIYERPQHEFTKVLLAAAAREVAPERGAVRSLVESVPAGERVAA